MIAMMRILGLILMRMTTDKISNFQFVYCGCCSLGD